MTDEEKKVEEITPNSENQEESAPVLTTKQKVKKGLSIGLTVVEVIAVVFLLIVSLLSMASTTTNATGVSSNPITGTSLFPVLSDSMAPVFKTGDLVYGKQFADADKDFYKRLSQLDQLKSDEDLGEKQGDIIVYWTKIGSDNVIVTHRIHHITLEGTVKDSNGNTYNVKGFWTRGDAEATTNSDGTPRDDNILCIDSHNIIAVYKGNVKYVGAIINTLQNNKTLMFCVLVLPLILLFLWNGFSFVRIIFQGKKDTAIEQINVAHEEEKAKLLEEAKRLALEELRKEMAKQDDKKDE